MKDKIKVSLQCCDLELLNTIKTEYIDKNIEFFFVEQNSICEKLWFDFDAVLFVESNNAEFNNQVNMWVGHPHFRFIKNDYNKYNNLRAEIDALLGCFELEKKFLIEFPDMDALSKYPIYKNHIEQTYLICDNGSHRIRKREYGDYTAYYETLKLRITNSKCIEHEGLISKDEYNALIQHKNPDKNTIIKDRYTFLYNAQYFELDIYPFWQDKAIVELELRDENQSFELPPEIKVIKDVSDDYRYKNNYLAGLKL